MKGDPRFSFARFRALVVKEFQQMRRDPLTLAMMVVLPLFQLILFGYAINADPKNLPAAVIVADHGPHGRAILMALKNSSYYDVVRELRTEEEARRELALGRVQFVVNVPEDFSRTLLRGERPAILVEADATDPGATGNALNTLTAVVQSALRDEFRGALAYLAGTPPPVDVRVHAHYNPEAITQYNIVPGLMGIVLTMTMVFVTGLAMTRERESGTMENLLSMPTRPLEVLLGKIVPYITVGYVQLVLILLASRFVFEVPMMGSTALLLALSLIFIVSNLAVGITFSTIAQNQRQAMQMGMFFFLPQMLLSGFMFPFFGMPLWAQFVGELFPLTHYLRIVRGIVLKGNGAMDAFPHLWQIALFAAVMLAIAMKRYRQTVD